MLTKNKVLRNNNIFINYSTNNTFINNRIPINSNFSYLFIFFIFIFFILFSQSSYSQESRLQNSYSQKAVIDLSAEIRSKSLYEDYYFRLFLQDNNYQKISDISSTRNITRDNGLVINQKYPSLEDNLKFSVDIDLSYPRIYSEDELKTNKKPKKDSNYYSYIKNSENLWNMLSPAVDYLNNRQMDEKDKFFKRMLDDLNILSEFCNGYVFNGKEWHFSSWVQVPSEDNNFLVFDFSLKEFGSFTTPHLALYCGNEVSYDFIQFRYAGEKEAEAALHSFNLSVSGSIRNSNNFPTIDIFPLYENIRVGSANAVSISITNNHEYYIPVILTQYAKSSLNIDHKEFIYFIPPSKKIYYDLVLKDIKKLKETNKYTLDFNINGIMYKTHFIVSPEGIFVEDSAVEDLIKKGVRVNNYPDYELFSQIVLDIPSYEINNFYEKHTKTRENLGIKREIINEDGKNIVVLTIDPRKSMFNVSIYENIPKCLAQRVNEISSKIVFDIIEEDPIIAWRINEITEPIEIRYDLSSDNISDCEDEAMTIAIAGIISDDLSTNTLGIIIPFFIAFITSVTIIFFTKYSKDVT